MWTLRSLRSSQTPSARRSPSSSRFTAQTSTSMLRDLRAWNQGRSSCTRGICATRALRLGLQAHTSAGSMARPLARTLSSSSSARWRRRRTFPSRLRSVSPSMWTRSQSLDGGACFCPITRRSETRSRSSSPSAHRTTSSSICDTRVATAVGTGQTTGPCPCSDDPVPLKRRPRALETNKERVLLREQRTRRRCSRQAKPSAWPQKLAA
eukprot:Amastigsp_a531_208.p2 type:complete len:209 gc:universal Amastigsp_a531_208:294-920(+)